MKFLDRARSAIDLHHFRGVLCGNTSGECYAATLPGSVAVQRIGLYGGTFNPIHIGHLMIAQMVLEKFSLDKVIFVPSYLPPHKSGRNLIAARHRLRMTRLAVRGNRNLEVSPFEIAKAENLTVLIRCVIFANVIPAQNFFLLSAAITSRSYMPGAILPNLLKWSHSSRCIGRDLKRFVPRYRSSR